MGKKDGLLGYLDMLSNSQQRKLSTVTKGEILENVNCPCCLEQLDFIFMNDYYFDVKLNVIQLVLKQKNDNKSQNSKAKRAKKKKDEVNNPLLLYVNNSFRMMVFDVKFLDTALKQSERNPTNNELIREYNPGQCSYCNDFLYIKFINMLTYPKPILKYKLLLPKTLSITELNLLVMRESGLKDINNLVLLYKSKPLNTAENLKSNINLQDLGIKRNGLVIISQVLGKPSERDLEITSTDYKNKNKEFVGNLLFGHACNYDFNSSSNGNAGETSEPVLNNTTLPVSNISSYYNTVDTSLSNRLSTNNGDENRRVHGMDLIRQLCLEVILNNIDQAWSAECVSRLHEQELINELDAEAQLAKSKQDKKKNKKKNQELKKQKAKSKKQSKNQTKDVEEIPDGVVLVKSKAPSSLAGLDSSPSASSHASQAQSSIALTLPSSAATDTASDMKDNVSDTDMADSIISKLKMTDDKTSNNAINLINDFIAIGTPSRNKQPEIEPKPIASPLPSLQQQQQLNHFNQQQQQQQQQLIKCITCNSHVPQSSNFCSNCGANITALKSIAAVNPALRTAPSSNDKSKRLPFFANLH